MRGIIIRALDAAIIPAILGINTSSIYKHNSNEFMKSFKKEHIVVRLPEAYRWIGVTGTVVFSLAIVLMILFPTIRLVIGSVLVYQVLSLRAYSSLQSHSPGR